MLRNLANLFVLFVLVTVFMYADVTKAQVVTDGLVAYWPLDASTIDGDTVEDVWGDNEGTINGDLRTVTGRAGEALEFDGTGFVDIPGTDSLNFNGKEEMTVAAWANVASDDPVDGVVAGCCGSIVAQRDVNSWALRYDGRNGGQEMEFIVSPGWTGDGGFGAPRFAVGEWHHLTGVVTVSELRLYLDGVLLETIAFAGPISSGGSETEIGHAGDGGFIGMIDEVLIYDRVLSDAEIMQIFQSEGSAAVNPNSKLAISWGEVKK
jgi:hypothetical protein